MSLLMEHTTNDLTSNYTYDSSTEGNATSDIILLTADTVQEEPTMEDEIKHGPWTKNNLPDYTTRAEHYANHAQAYTTYGEQ